MSKTFTFDTPDGRITVEGPDGATAEQAVPIAQQALASRKRTAPADALGALGQGAEAEAGGVGQGLRTFGRGAAEVGGMIGRGLMTIDQAKDDFTTEAVRGVFRTGAGAAQAVADQFSPDAGAKIGRVAQSATPEPEGVAGKAGRFAGEVLPYFLTPGGPVVQGILGGATELQESGDEGTRQENRALASGLGGAGGVVLKGLGSLVGKVGNTMAGRAALKEAADRIGVFSDRVVDTDPALAGTKSRINEPVERKLAAFNSKAEAIRVAGDVKGPVPVADLEAELKLTKEEMSKLGQAGDRTASTTVRSVLKDFVGATDEPESITSRQGITLTRVGPGRYELPGGKVLSGPAVDALLQGWKGRRPPILLSQLRGHVERLDEVLDANPGSKDPAVVQAGKLRNVLQDKVDEFTDPAVKRAQGRLDTFYEKEIAPFKQKDVAELLQTDDPLERANRALRIATDGSPRDAQTVADLFGKRGREAVLSGVIKKALDSAMDLKSNRLDPEKFAAFMGRDSVKPFVDKETGVAVQGVEQLLGEAKDLGVESTLGRASGGLGRMGAYVVHAGTWGTIWSLMEGNMKHAAAAAATTAATAGAFKLVGRLMEDGFGRQLLRAAARTKPGTPAWTRLSQTIVQRFGAPAAGVGAANALSDGNGP